MPLGRVMWGGEEGRGSASVKVKGKVPGCQESGREWRERSRKVRMLLCVSVRVCVFVISVCMI